MKRYFKGAAYKIREICLSRKYHGLALASWFFFDGKMGADIYMYVLIFFMGANVAEKAVDRMMPIKRKPAAGEGVVE